MSSEDLMSLVGGVLLGLIAPVTLWWAVSYRETLLYAWMVRRRFRRNPVLSGATVLSRGEFVIPPHYIENKEQGE